MYSRHRSRQTEQQDMEKAVQALEEFKRAAVALDRHWHEILEEGLPRSMTISFDEYTNEVLDWYDTVRTVLNYRR